MSTSSTNPETARTWDAVLKDSEGLVAERANEITNAGKKDPFFSGTVYRITGWRRWLLLYPAILILKLYYATLRVRLAPEEARLLRETPEPTVGMAWHNHSLIVPLLIRRYRDPSRCCCLISPSKAAAWEDAVFELLGIPSARGSSSRRSIIAMCEMIHAYDKGYNIYISPDGPVGPRFRFKRGAVAAARMTKAPILLAGATCASAFRPATWDRHIIPLPFSTVNVHIRIFNNMEIFDGSRNDAEICRMLEEELKKLTGERE